MSQKLKGIYDALDHGNYKNASKLCSALLQKQPAHALCKALQAVALERCGRRDEALRLCGEAALGSGVDDTVLSTCQVVYRRCRQGATIVQMYDAASTREPENEEYAVALFLATIREGEFGKSQQVATKLYKKFNKPSYLHWIIVAILLQAEGGGSPKALDLAEMMLKKAPVNLEALKAERENVPLNRPQLYLLQLHLTTLRLQGKYTEALQLLEAGRGFVRLPADVAGLRLRLLADAGQFREAAAHARETVCNGTSDWATIREYIRLAFQCPASRDLPLLTVETGGEKFTIADHGARLKPVDSGALPAVVSMEDVDRCGTHDAVWNALLLFRHLQRSEASAWVRVALLAELELRRLAFCQNAAELGMGREGAWRAAVAEGDLGEFVAAVGSYLRRFGHRSACYFELKPFLCLLDLEEAASLPGLGLPVGEGAPDADASTPRLRRAFRRPRDGASAEDLLGDARGLLQRWATARGADNPQGPDDLLALAVAALADLDRRCCRHPSLPQGGTYLIDAVAIADIGLSANPHAFQLKVLLVLIYGVLGAPGPMLQIYNKMDIKNIQHESLSYLVLDVLSSLGCHDSLHEVCQSIIQFHEEADKDGGDALSMAFHSGVLHRVPEYLESLTRMGRSALWGRAVVDEVLCDLGQSQTWDALTECLFRQSVLVSAIASKPAGHWVLGNQDRGVLSSLHPLPLSAPTGGTMAAPTSRATWPTTLVQGGRSPAVSSSAMVWRAGEAAAPERQADVSALEEVLGRSGGVAASPRHLAALLEGLCALLREGACEERLVAALSTAREALQAAGGDSAAESRGVAAALADMAAERDGPGNGATGLWSSWAVRFAIHASSGALEAMEAALQVVRCIAAKEPWDRAEAKLARLAEAAEALLRFAGAAAEDLGRSPFALGGCGARCVWALLHRCLPVLIPASLWCCTAMPKAGSGKKAKEGQEALHASRVGLRNLLSTLQTGLIEIQESLASVHNADAGTLFALPTGGTEGLPGQFTLEDLPELVKHREHARELLLEAHKRHLQALRDAAGARLALLRSRGAFRP
mmetsp:Transcript_16174/g.50500  ORF Transcript_16174/g.50500 Transcript_16174/m.50500 type:complete len:1049 (-) Transcript_16174:38-3184(-)